MKSITLSIVAVVVLGGLVYFYTRSATSEPAKPINLVLTIENVPGMLRGVTMHIPVDNTSVDVLIDSYAAHDTSVLGGTTEDAKSTVTVFIPEFNDTFTQGAWGVVDGASVYVPTYINFGGTGQFFMVALFTYDANTKTLTHQDLHFVNDRIAFDGMVQSGEKMAAIHYRTHAEGEAMTDEPTLAATRTLRINEDRLELIE